MKISSAGNTPLETLLSLQSGFDETYACSESFGVPASPNVLGLPQSLCIPPESFFLRCDHLPSLKTTPVHNTAESALLHTITLNHARVYARVCIAYEVEDHQSELMMTRNSTVSVRRI